MDATGCLGLFKQEVFPIWTIHSCEAFFFFGQKKKPTFLKKKLSSLEGLLYFSFHRFESFPKIFAFSFKEP